MSVGTTKKSTIDNELFEQILRCLGEQHILTQTSDRALTLGDRGETLSPARSKTLVGRMLPIPVEVDADRPRQPERLVVVEHQRPKGVPGEHEEGGGRIEVCVRLQVGQPLLGVALGEARHQDRVLRTLCSHDQARRHPGEPCRQVDHALPLGQRLGRDLG